MSANFFFSLDLRELELRYPIFEICRDLPWLNNLVQNLFLLQNFKIYQKLSTIYGLISFVIIIGIRGPYYFATIDNNLNNFDKNLLETFSQIQKYQNIPFS